jgi:hypothetical protein
LKHSTFLRLLYTFTLLLLVTFLVSSGLATAYAQDQVQTDPWMPSVNLSKSGGAVQPMVMADPGGTIHVLWWDQFDLGRYTFYTDRTGWNPVFLALAIKAGADNRAPSSWKMVTDQAHQLYVFWTDNIGNLWYARLNSATTSFSEGQLLASGMVTWDVQVDTTGSIHLVYAQAGGGSGLAAAGVYYRYSGNGVNWEAPVTLVTSPYFRTLQSDIAFVSVAGDGKGQIFVTWDDPFEKRAQMAYSQNNGGAFSVPTPVISGEVAQGAVARQARLLVEPGGKFLMMWQAGASCAIYQQEWTKQAGEINADLKSVVAAESVGAGWTAPHRVLEALNGCVHDYRYYSLTRPESGGLSKGSLALLVRTGTDVEMLSTPTLAVWNQKDWTEPVSLQISIVDPLTKYLNALGCLDVTVVSDRLAALGCDENGDVWATQSKITLDEFISAQQHAWSQPQLISTGDNPPADLPVLAADSENRLHVIYPVLSPDASTTSSGGGKTNGIALAYVRLSDDSWTRPSLVLKSPATSVMAQTALDAGQPAIVSDPAGPLLVAWSGGPTGQVYISSAFPHDAGFTTGWSIPMLLPAVSPVGGSPSLAIDFSGKLYAAYAVPLNEGRGVYLSVSEDKGATWLTPTTICAVTGSSADDQNNMPMFGSVRLLLDDQGVLHVAWVVTGLPPDSSPLGVYYSNSVDGGFTWSTPQQLSQGPADKPQFCLAAPGQLHLFWNKILDNGSELYQQWTLDGGLNWSEATRVMNLRNISERVGLVADGQGTVYLVGLEHTPQDSVALVSLRWDGSTWWTAPEHLLLGFDWSDNVGVTAILVPGGKLVAFYRINVPDQDGILQPALGFVQRPVDVRPLAPLPTFTPQSVVTATPLPTLFASPTPIPTPKVTTSPTRSFSNSDLIRITAILVGMLVIVYLALRGLSERSKKN